MIKSILGGKSKNLCDLAYLLTLPLDTTFQNSGFWRVLINAEPNTTYTFSRENADQITGLGNTYLAISVYDDISHNNWLSHQSVPSLNNKSATLTTSSDGKLWILFNRDFYNNYWQKNLNPFGYIQLELGSTATEYVPHELTSYKSIMKVSDVCQLGDKRKYNPTETKSGVTFTNNGDGTITVNGTSTQLVEFFLGFIDFIKNHTYLLIGCPSGGSTSTYILDTGARIGNDVGNGTISKPGLPGNKYFSIYVYANTTCNNLVFKPQLFDLTEMFGAGNEPKTVAEFKAKFPNDYYPYSPSCFVTSFDERMPCKTKNLFNISNADIISREYYFTPNQGAGSNFYVMTVKPGTTYTVTYERFIMSTDTLAGNALELSIQTGTHYRDGTQLLFRLAGGETGVWVKRSGQFTVPSDINQVTFSGLKDRFLYHNFMVQEGTTATDYVPYGYV